MISLTRLEKAIAAKLAKVERIDEEMLNLAGLVRVQYVFVYPETKDIVIAGPAEGYMSDPTGRVIGIETGSNHGHRGWRRRSDDRLRWWDRWLWRHGKAARRGRTGHGENRLWLLNRLLAHLRLGRRRQRPGRLRLLFNHRQQAHTDALRQLNQFIFDRDIQHGVGQYDVQQHDHRRIRQAFATGQGLFLAVEWRQNNRSHRRRLIHIKKR